jgi:hypothetical protein
MCLGGFVFPDSQISKFPLERFLQELDLNFHNLISALISMNSQLKMEMKSQYKISARCNLQESIKVLSTIDNNIYI